MRRSCGKGEVGDGDGFSGPVYGSDASSHAQQQNQQFLGDTSLALPVFSSIDIGRNAVLPDGITRADVEAFEKLYRDHAEASFLPDRQSTDQSITTVPCISMLMSALVQLRHVTPFQSSLFLYPLVCEAPGCLFDWLGAILMSAKYAGEYYCLWEG